MRSFVRYLHETIEAFFASQTSPKFRWLTWTWIAILFIGGGVLWAFFFNWGKLTFNFHDWADITGPRLTFLQDAIQRGVLPLHISDTSTLGKVTDRFMSTPDVFLSPQVLLLKFLSVASFVLVNQLLMYAIGFVGLLWLKRHFSLSLAAFTILALLFNFNGHVEAHFAVGHDTWGGYFLYPWFAALVFQLLEGTRSWTWVAKTAGLLFLMFLQGSFHQFVWGILFLGFVGVSSRHFMLPSIKAAGFALALSLVRLLPPSLLMNQYGKDFGFMAGYATLADIWKYMVTIPTPGVLVSGPGTSYPLGTWEYDLYTGLIGAAFLLFFGIYRWLSDVEARTRFQALIFPLVGLTLLSLGQFYAIVRALPLPLLDGERVSSRMISYVLVFVLILAVTQFQRWLDSRRFTPAQYGFQLVLLVAGASDLWQHFTAWQVTNAMRFYSPSHFVPSIWFAVDRVDIPYVRMLAWGAVGSVVAFTSLIALVAVERRSEQGRPGEVVPPRPAGWAAFGNQNRVNPSGSRGSIRGQQIPVIPITGQTLQPVRKRETVESSQPAKEKR